MTDDLRCQVRQARGKFVAMAGSYSLGVFNDSFFRQAAILLAGLSSKGMIMMLFALPYVLLPAQAGWFADRYSKRRVVIGAKIMEVAAMAVGAIGIWTANWPMILTMTFMMALQSCVFGPALNGSIPELYPPSYVNKANAILKAFVTVCILSGVALSGIVLDAGKAIQPFGIGGGRFLIGCGVLVIAALGLVLSFGTVRRPAAAPRQRFPRKGTLEIIARLREIAADPLLLVVVLADTFVWATGSLLVLVIAAMEERQFLFSNITVSTMTAAQLVGVAIGGGLSSLIDITRRWQRMLPALAAGMGVALLSASTIAWTPDWMHLPVLYVLLAVAGVMAGLLMIPCESFIQIRPAPDRKGAVIAASNFTIFFGIMLSGPIADVMNTHFDPTVSLTILGGFALLVAVALQAAVRKVLR